MTSVPPPTQPLSFRLLLDEAVRHARQHFRRIYPAVAIPLALAGGALPLIQLSFSGYMILPGRTGPAPGAVLLGFVASAVAMLVVMTVYLLGYSVLVVAALNALAQREVSMARAWLFVLRPRVLGTLILKTIVIGFGLIFCMVPGIYWSLLLSLALPVMVEEARFGTGALRRSGELARYNPLRDLEADPRLKAFLIYFVGILLGQVANFVIQLPLVAIQQVMMFRDLAGGQRMDPATMMRRLAWVQVPSAMLGMLIQAAVYLYMSFGIALLFFDVKRRKEGLDLEVAIAHVMATRGISVAEAGPLPSPPATERPEP
ncbi:MAG TPA: hypothetical protein VN461_11720 [Vicinamibacteria bacterium]|nr:hypothetical protein [Vicinamibacteria bacterium]